MIELESTCLFVVCHGAEEFWLKLKEYDYATYQRLLYAAQDETAKELEGLRARSAKD